MYDICVGFATIEQFLWREIRRFLFVIFIYTPMVSHDTFKNIILFALVAIFLYYLFKDKIHTVTEEPFSVKDVIYGNQQQQPTQGIESKPDTGAMTAANTGIDRSLIKNDDEIGILSTCQQNSGGELVKNCSEIQAYNYEYDTSFDKFLRPTSFDQPTFLKSNGL
jgi:hypothetical protein